MPDMADRGGLGLPRERIDRGSPIPPYEQIAADLRTGIETGKYPAGTRLPSVETLVGTYGVARTTARKALILLRREGHAVMRRGWGTFVAGQPGDRG